MESSGVPSCIVMGAPGMASPSSSILQDRLPCPLGSDTGCPQPHPCCHTADTGVSPPYAPKLPIPPPRVSTALTEEPSRPRDKRHGPGGRTASPCAVLGPFCPTAPPWCPGSTTGASSSLHGCMERDHGAFSLMQCYEYSGSFCSLFNRFECEKVVELGRGKGGRPGLFVRGCCSSPGFIWHLEGSGSFSPPQPLQRLSPFSASCLLA